MDRKRQLGYRLRRRMKKDEMNTHSFHSLSYHRFFENYTERQVVGKNGRKRIVREYAGPIYQQELSPLNYVLLRLLYLSLFVVMIWMVILAGVPGRASDSAWYMAVTELATILLLSLMGYTLLTGYLFVPRQMTTGDYNESSRFLLWKAMGLGICFSLDAAATLLYIVLHQNIIGKADWRALAAFLVGAGIAFSMWFMERNIPYQVTNPSEKNVRDGEIEILYQE